MDASESETEIDTDAQEKDSCERKCQFTDNECSEDDFNPLGFLDLVYVEEEEDKDKIYENDLGSSVSTSNNEMEQGKSMDVNLADSDEDEEILEPFAAVDVSPVREEDFLPEGLVPETEEPGRTTRMITRVTDADTVHHQWRLGENQAAMYNHQPVIRSSKSLWIMQNPVLPSHFQRSSHYQLNESQNLVSVVNHSNHPLKQVSPELLKLYRRKYYQQYRERNADLVRIRNREYTRRYRQAHAERVRQRQREYVKKYRERKKLEEAQHCLFNSENEKYNRFLNNALSSDFVARSGQEMPTRLVSKIPDQVILPDDDESAVLVLN